MKKTFLGLMIVASSLLAGDLITFVPGTPAKATEVNANFDELDSRTKNITSLNGNIGIGTKTPNDLLEVKATGVGKGAYIRATNSAGQFWRFVSDGSGEFELNNGTKIPMRINPTTGYIGIGGHWDTHDAAPQSEVQIKGYIQLATTSGNTPSNSDCDEDTEYGRMKVDEVNDLLYICTQSGWVSK